MAWSKSFIGVRGGWTADLGSPITDWVCGQQVAGVDGTADGQCHWMVVASSAACFPGSCCYLQPHVCRVTITVEWETGRDFVDALQASNRQKRAD
jgi:hypothetical protein